MSNSIVSSPEIFFSYAWGGESERIVESLEQEMQQKGLQTVRDKTNGVGYRGLIQDFMQRIGRGNFVVVVISDKYLKSPYCMYELLEIYRNLQFEQRIYPIVLQDAKIFDGLDRLQYLDYWKGKKSQLEHAFREHGPDAISVIGDDYEIIRKISENFGEVTSILKDINSLTPEMHQEGNFQEIIGAIEEAVTVDDKKNLRTPEKGETSFQNFTEIHKHFCDRSVQEADFITYYDELSSQKFQFYIVHGDEMQSHIGLVKRFLVKELDLAAEGLNIVILQEASSEKAYKTLVKRELFRSYLGRDINQYALSDLNVNLLSDLVKQEGRSKEAVVFRLESSRWKEFTPNLLNWFANEFCDEGSLSGNDPRFFFFLSVVYADDVKPVGFFQKLTGKKDRKKLIIEEFNKLTAKNPLPELSMVTRQDVEEWIGEYLAVNDMTKNKIYEAYFGTKPSFYMEEVEAELENIIEDFNQQSEKLRDLGVKWG